MIAGGLAGTAAGDPSGTGPAREPFVVPARVRWEMPGWFRWGTPGWASRKVPGWAGLVAPEDPVRFAHRLRQVAVTVLLLGIAGFLIDGANRPANPYLVGPSPAGGPTSTGAGPTGGSEATTRSSAVTAGSTVRAVSPLITSGVGRSGVGPIGAAGGPAGLAGFGTTELTVTTPGSGPVRRACVLVAATQAQQEQGLMNQQSLGRFAGMAFVFDRPTTVLFYMRDTPMPLSIAWFSSGGAFLSSRDMPPCPDSALTCPTYGPAMPYTLGLEVPAGHLPGLGIGPGSVAQLGGACT